MIKIKYLTLSIIGAAFIGCGGGGGTTSTTIDKTVTGSVEASYLKNVKVCVKDSEICTLTDSQGKFKLPVEYPIAVDLYIGENKLGSVDITSKDFEITPSILADANVSLSGYLGAFLHFASTGKLNTTYCDMNNIKNLELNANGNTIIEKLKNYSYKDGNLTFRVNDKNYTVTFNDVDYYITSNPLKAGIKDIEYGGAATVGDYVNFNLDYHNKKIAFKFRGKVLNNYQKSVGIYDLYKNMFFIGDDASSFFFVTRGIMVSKIVNSKGSFDTITIPSNYRKLTVNDISKTYNVMVKGLNLNNDYYNAFVNITLNPDKTYLMFVKTLDNNNLALSFTGKWELDNENRVVVYNNNNEPFLYLKIKKGYYKNILVLDGINGGFGLGVEAKDITKNDLKTYYYLNIQPINSQTTKVCFGYSTEKMVDTNKIEIKETDQKCMIARSYTSQGVITFEQVPVSSQRVYVQTINPTFNINGQDIKLSGIAVDNNQISIIDGDNGLYINYSFDLNKSGSIGSDRGLN